MQRVSLALSEQDIGGLILARTGHADGHRECLFIGVDRKPPAGGQNGAFDPLADMTAYLERPLGRHPLPLKLSPIQLVRESPECMAAPVLPASVTPRSSSRARAAQGGIGIMVPTHRLVPDGSAKG